MCLGVVRTVSHQGALTICDQHCHGNCICGSWKVWLCIQDHHWLVCRWIHHHYWSIGTCMLLLMLPVDSPAVQFCVAKFLWWAWWQSVVMILQNRWAPREGVEWLGA